MVNRLAQESSPYLRQHADNPVDWHPWDQTALELARSEDKPILLSIGYSACHWCHVMAHESFEDRDTADLMNRLYVNIKVDREERPDLDRIYQTAHQMFTGRAGGWPLTLFLTPTEHLPIFAGTYFPKAASFGMPAFKEVLVRVESYFREHLSDVLSNGATLVEALNNLTATETDDTAAFTHLPIKNARTRLGNSFDSEHGGFGDAPKFPHPTNLDFLLELWQQKQQTDTSDDGARRMITHSLDQMALRGLFDHLGGGFFRYSVDRRWAVPHFEKMLYDNAALLATYSDAYAATQNALYAEVAAQTADWVTRDMQDERGGFYATLDADSEGEEGRFYFWTPDQFKELLDEHENVAATKFFGLDKDANFENKSWHLQIAEPSEEPLLISARRKLLAARNRRVWPTRDDKLIVSWNGLMIAAMAKASRHLHRPELEECATRAVDFIRSELWMDGRLKATYKDGRARFAAYLDDYAFLASGLLELLQCRWRSVDLQFACDLVDVMLTHFADERGGFFFTADDHERLIHKPKPLADEAIPAGNGVAALVLTNLGHLLGEERYLAAAARTLQTALPFVERYPEAHATLLRGIQRQLVPPELVIVRGDSKELAEWRKAVGHRPQRLSFFIPTGVSDLPGLLGQRAVHDGAVAYVCQGTQCLAPITDLSQLTQALS